MLIFWRLPGKKLPVVNTRRGRSIAKAVDYLFVPLGFLLLLGNFLFFWVISVEAHAKNCRMANAIIIKLSNSK